MDKRTNSTKAAYKAALKSVELLMHAGANTPEGERLDALVKFIEDYELVHFPMDSQSQRTSRFQ